MGGLDPRQIARGLRRIVFGWKGGPPNLPDFMRLCRTVGDDDFDEGPRELPRLIDEGPTQDEWEVTANRHLFAHIMRRMQADPKCFGEPATAHGMRVMTTPSADASPEFVAAVHRLVAAKKAWAADMRELATNGPVPIDLQQVIWRDYINGATNS